MEESAILGTTGMRRKQVFTMVELLIALGVCAIGICSIMVLIPVGASATRDAALETYAAQAAEQLLNYLEYSATLSADDWDNTVGTSDPELITETKPKGANLEFTIIELNAPGKWEKTFADNIYYRKSTDSEDQPIYLPIYLILSHRNESHCNEEGVYLGDKTFNLEKIDFRAILAVWKEQISVNGIKIPYETGVRLNIEVSWPAEIPYGARQKALYCLEVFNPHPHAQNQESSP
jgi:type II secretory pathway pseudopilin PulG